ncbi:MAG: 3-oxoacyl-[acyl-carrier-protein] reductase, partial [Chloroflexi bacterium RBG_16_64_32]
MSCLNDKVAIVTGSSRGLGRAFVRELADHGCKVVINYFQSKEAGEQLLAELKDKGQEAICVQAGVAHPDDVQNLIDVTVKEFGGIDILINNAGVKRDRTIRRMSVEEWREVLATDLDSVFYCTYAALPHMIERGGGRIVNTSSIVGQMGNLGQSNYAAAKAGIVGFTKSAAQEFARYNITVNALCPGFIETEMVTSLTDEVRQALLAKIPLGRFGTPE